MFYLIMHKKVIGITDVLYVTRIQKERFSSEVLNTRLSVSSIIMCEII